MQGKFKRCHEGETISRSSWTSKAPSVPSRAQATLRWWLESAGMAFAHLSFMAVSQGFQNLKAAFGALEITQKKLQQAQETVHRSHVWSQSDWEDNEVLQKEWREAYDHFNAAMDEFNTQCAVTVDRLEKKMQEQADQIEKHRLILDRTRV
jgi:hypothetical protein